MRHFQLPLLRGGSKRPEAGRSHGSLAPPCGAYGHLGLGVGWEGGSQHRFGQEKDWLGPST